MTYHDEPPSPIDEREEGRSCSTVTDIQIIDTGLREALGSLGRAKADHEIAYYTGRVLAAFRDAAYMHDVECVFDGDVTVAYWRGGRRTWTCPNCGTDYTEED